MTVGVVVEYNDGGCLIHSEDFPGAYARGRTREEALGKLSSELSQYAAWAGRACGPFSPGEIKITLEKESGLQIADADSDVLFPSERSPLTRGEYEALKALALRSALDFTRLYQSIPDKTAALSPKRKTFYGSVPRTAEEMFSHVARVNGYYFGEIGIPAKDGNELFSCRAGGFEALERTEGFLDNRVFEGSCGEEWTLRKVCRRFVWHDRIHAKAMLRLSYGLFGRNGAENPYLFEL